MITILILLLILPLAGVLVLALTYKKARFCQASALREMRAYEAWDDEVLSEDIQKVRMDLIRAVRQGWDAQQKEAPKQPASHPELV